MAEFTLTQRDDAPLMGEEARRARCQQAEMEAALDFAHMCGAIDGAHHKMWVIDQMVRALPGAGYDEWVRLQRDGSDGPNTYEWDEGIAP